MHCYVADFCVVSDSECQSNVADFRAVTTDVNWREQKNFQKCLSVLGYLFKSTYVQKSHIQKSDIWHFSKPGSSVCVAETHYLNCSRNENVGGAFGGLGFFFLSCFCS